jgi:hypothetical protein
VARLSGPQKIQLNLLLLIAAMSLQGVYENQPFRKQAIVGAS